MGVIGYRGRVCVTLLSLESERKGKEEEVITDRRTDKWTEFPFVDSTPVRGRVKINRHRYSPLNHLNGPLFFGINTDSVREVVVGRKSIAWIIFFYPFLFSLDICFKYFTWIVDGHSPVCVDSSHLIIDVLPHIL